MSPSLRAVGIAAALVVGSPSVATAQSLAPPTLAGTDLIAPPPPGAPGSLTVRAARCSASSGFALYTATGTAVNGGYVGSFREDGAAQLGPGGLSPDFEPRALRAAGHRFLVASPAGRVVGTQHAADVPDAATCVQPYFDTADLYLSYLTDTRYAARIETPAGVYVDRGQGSVSVDLVETLDGQRTGNTRTSFASPDAETTQLLRQQDCRQGGFAELAFITRRRCERVAGRNPTP